MIKPINIGRRRPMSERAVEVIFGRDTEFTKECIENLKDTFKKHAERASGLAMNQISDINSQIPRIFIAKIPLQEEPEIFINPRGVGSGGHQKDWESCLSFPNSPPRKKSRYKNYTILYYNEAGEEQTLKVGRPWSRTLQHEMDHLNGKVIYPPMNNV